jgi:hypothetical protein
MPTWRQLADAAHACSPQQQQQQTHAIVHFMLLTSWCWHAFKAVLHSSVLRQAKAPGYAHVPTCA